MSHGEFSVCQFFVDDSYEYVRRYVDQDEAVKAVKHYCDNVASRMGITKRVIITDGGDCVCFEWRFGEGVVFPPNGDTEQEKSNGQQQHSK